MAEVRGSSPLSSIVDSEPVPVGINVLCDGLGSWWDRVAAGEEIIPPVAAVP